MSHITLIRHGQANSDARDEADYDRLSDLGWQQAKWLGQYLDGTGLVHSRFYCGTLRRHRETAEGMGIDAGALIIDERLNELEYFTMAQLYETQHNRPVPAEREEFVSHLPAMFGAWQRGELDGAPETFEAFETRIRDAMADIRGGDGPAMVVTSGGLISNALSQGLGLDLQGMSQLALSIMNTSMHRLFPIGDRLSPVLFNAVPHLERPERQFAQTHV